ncbi:hypothetical protein Tco_0468153 [Tanacetum coccineum]
MANVTSWLTSLGNIFKIALYFRNSSNQTVTNHVEQNNAITTESGLLKLVKDLDSYCAYTRCFYSSKEPNNKKPGVVMTKVALSKFRKVPHKYPRTRERKIPFSRKFQNQKLRKPLTLKFKILILQRPNSYQSKLPIIPSRIESEKRFRRERIKPSAQHSGSWKMLKTTFVYEIGVRKDALVRNAKVQQMVKLEQSFEKLEESQENFFVHLGKEELVYYADKSEKNKHFVHAISVIDFSKDDPFSGSTTTHSDDPSPSSSPVKTSDNLEEFADELTLLKKDIQEGNFQDHSNPLFEFDENFKSSTINPLFDEMEEDVEIKNSNVSDEPVLLNTPLSDKVECFAPEDNIDEIDAFLAMEVSSNFEEGYFDSEGDVTFLDNLLSDDTTHNLASEVISDHEPEQNESSITGFSQEVILFTMSSPVNF